MIQLIALSATIAFLLWPGNSLLNIDTSLTEILIERMEILDNEIVSYIRNIGPVTIQVV
jgi:hypothetical protein